MLVLLLALLGGLAPTGLAQQTLLALDNTLGAQDFYMQGDAVLAPQVVLGGNPLSRTPSPGLETCIQECAKEPQCAWFNYAQCGGAGANAVGSARQTALDRRRPCGLWCSLRM